MALACLSPTTLNTAQRQFENALPQIQRSLKYHFRRWPRRLRAEALEDALAACWHAWVGLVRRGQDPVVVGPTGIAYYAARYTKAGRRLGCGPCGRSHVDIFDRRTQHRLGLRIVSVDHDGRWDLGTGSDAWRERLIEDRRAGPADTAAIRIDVADWLDRLPPRKRTVPQVLALGEATVPRHEALGVTPGAVSQTRAWLHENWQSFQEPMTFDAGLDVTVPFTFWNSSSRIGSWGVNRGAGDPPP